jgi:hypothetical protein
MLPALSEEGSGASHLLCRDDDGCSLRPRRANGTFGNWFRSPK